MSLLPPPPQPERRGHGEFIEKMSMTIIVMAGLGTLLVLIDPVITIVLESGTTIKLGGNGFADQFKGSVLTLIVASGFAAVIGYWLGASNQGQKAQDSVTTLAVAAAPATAAAVAASRAPAQAVLKAGTMNAVADEINIQQGDPNAPTDKP